MALTQKQSDVLMLQLVKSFHTREQTTHKIIIWSNDADGTKTRRHLPPLMSLSEPELLADVYRKPRHSIYGFLRLYVY